MSEIVSPESKLYVKEEVEKAKKEIKEDIEKANSKAARTFTIVGVVLGILTGVGVYGLAANYVKTAIKDGLSATAIIQLESDVKEKVGAIQEIYTVAKVMKKELIAISELQKIANLPVRTIIPSMLDPKKFADAVGDPFPFDSNESKWVLADGSMEKVPDLRGMFLRGMNVEGGQDPEPNRKAGRVQQDALQQHTHDTNAIFIQWKGKKGWKKGQGVTGNPNNKWGSATVRKVKDDEHTNSATETRPKNVAVYFYIKIK